MGAGLAMFTLEFESMGAMAKASLDVVRPVSPAGSPVRAWAGSDATGYGSA